jgi:hypothetical protein
VPLALEFDQRQGFGLKRRRGRIVETLELVTKEFFQHYLPQLKRMERERVTVLAIVGSWVLAGPEWLLKG